MNQRKVDYRDLKLGILELKAHDLPHQLPFTTTE